VQPQDILDIGTILQGIHEEDFRGPGNPKDEFDAFSSEDFQYGMTTSHFHLLLAPPLATGLACRKGTSYYQKMRIAYGIF
jgi:hypothetical protein